MSRASSGAGRGRAIVVLRAQVSEYHTSAGRCTTLDAKCMFCALLCAGNLASCSGAVMLEDEHECQGDEQAGG